MIIYVHFILFEGIGKRIPFNSILDFAILSNFKMRNVIISLKEIISQTDKCAVKLSSKSMFFEDKTTKY